MWYNILNLEKHCILFFYLPLSFSYKWFCGLSSFSRRSILSCFFLSQVCVVLYTIFILILPMCLFFALSLFFFYPWYFISFHILVSFDCAIFSSVFRHLFSVLFPIFQLLFYQFFNVFFPSFLWVTFLFIISLSCSLSVCYLLYNTPSFIAILTTDCSKKNTSISKIIFLFQSLSPVKIRYVFIQILILSCMLRFLMFSFSSR